MFKLCGTLVLALAAMIGWAASVSVSGRERILLDPPPVPSGGSGVEAGPPGPPRWVELDDFVLGDAPPPLLRSDPELPVEMAFGPPPQPRVAFDAINDTGGLIPPDTHMAVGALLESDGRVMMVTNQQVAIWDKLGNLVAGPITLNAFFGISPPPPQPFAFDPKILYDQHSNRFFVVALQGTTPNPGGTNNIHIAVSSSGAPNNLTTEWTFSVGTGLTTVGGFNTWSDYPGIGADNLALFVTFNLFDASVPNNLFRGIKIRVFNKTQVMAGNNNAFTDINLAASMTASTAQPAHVYGSTANGGFYLISRVGQAAYRLYHVTGHPAAPILTTNTFAWAAGAFPADTGADQCSVANPDIDTLSTRMQNAIYRNGQIWCTMAADPDGDGQVEVVWQAIADNSYPTGTPAVSQSGFINGSGAAPWTYMPSINVNAVGDAVIVYTQSSTTECPNMYYAARVSPDPPGMFQAPVLVRSSAGFYDSAGASDPDRWGDYAATVIDPADDSFWIAQEFAFTSGVNSSLWGTHIAGFQTDCNNNGVYDPLDIADGTSPDLDGNGIPDECEGCSTTERQKLTASDASGLDRFGISVAVSGDVAVVGAQTDDDARPGNQVCDSGSAYVFRFNGFNWVQEQKLLASDAACDDRFGFSVSTSGDLAVVGAWGDDDVCPDFPPCNSGSAYVFRFNGTNWIQEAKLTASDAGIYDVFGWSVSISGEVAVVGAYHDSPIDVNSGSAYVFVKPPGGWVNMTETAKLLPSDGAWNDQFGWSVSISGDVIVVGAHFDDDNAFNAGSAYVFDKPPGGWVDMTETAKLTASNAAVQDQFGTSVSITGDTAIVGAPTWSFDPTGPGSAYVFVRSGSTWTQQAKLTASDAALGDQFGRSVSISGATAIVGAFGDSDNGSQSGSAYVFIKSGAIWVEEAKLLASDAAAGDYFGYSVAVSGGGGLIGAFRDDGSTGSAYVFCGLSDCNGNNQLDLCEFQADPTLDQNANCIMDQCDVDCNGNGQADFLDIIFGTSDDCNGNGVPDECDIADGTSLDTNGNGIPDECEPSCGNGAPDPGENCQNCPADVQCPTGTECIAGMCERLCGNGVPDPGENCENCPADVQCPAGTECIAGMCERLCGNGVVDPGENCQNCPADVQCPAGTECIAGMCERLCGNGVVDPGENCQNCPADVQCPAGTECIAGVCEPLPSIADISGPLGPGFPDGCVDAFDLGTLLGAWCSSASDPDPPGDVDPPCEGCTSPNFALADISGAANVADGCVDAFDLAKLLAEWCSVAGGNPCGTCGP
ncbi:MAG: hypothetical protein IH830_10715 [Planctomycetes bacterium]|nr:hypothetical protein [Planctomycetota bacterium]